MPSPPAPRDVPRRAGPADGGGLDGVRASRAVAPVDPEDPASSAGRVPSSPMDAAAPSDASDAALSAGPAAAASMSARSPAPRVAGTGAGPIGRLWAAWLAWLSAYEADERETARFLAQQLRAILQLTPLSMGINVANGTVLVALLWLQVPTGLLLGWFGAVAAMAAWGLRGWLRTRHRPLRPASPRGLRRAVIGAGVFGVVWGVVPAYAWPMIDGTGRLFVGMVMAGMICAGGFAMSSLPPAAIAYVTMLSLGSTIGVMRTIHDPIAPGVMAMLLAYALVVVYCVQVYGRTLGARLTAESRAERQNEVIALLLRDFQDNSCDLLWEIDADGRFVHVSSRLASVLEIEAARLPRRRAMAVLRMGLPQDDEARERWRGLRQLLAARMPFRDQVIALGRTGRRSWWTLNARPLLDDAGQFQGWRGVASDISERHQAQRRLQWLAHNDSLTGLVNRAQFSELLHMLLDAQHGGVEPLAVAVVDLDGFKQINDTIGHAAGDAMLREAGQRLLTVARRSDTVARLGGDEFAMIVRGARDRVDVARMMDRLLEAFGRPMEIEGRMLSVRASVGVSFAPGDATDVDAVLQHADAAMYCAKNEGGHRWHFYESKMTAVARRRAVLVEALKGAAGRGELRLAFQPQVDARSGAVSGFEALLRWHHPALGEVRPAEFVPVAEAAGLMTAIGDWVLQEACRHALRWPGELSIAVNLSATQLGSAGIVERIAAASQSLHPSRLELEITETSLIEDTEAAVMTLKALRARGWRVALDDFGTGYSALSYLRRFPFDTLKIDRSFVGDLSRNGEARIIVDTILAMARALDMATVAEGVEQEVEAEMLRQRGCTTLQGYYFGRPIPSEDVQAFLLRDARARGASPASRSATT